MISEVECTEFIIVVAFAVGALMGSYVNVHCINTISQIQFMLQLLFQVL